MFIYLIKINNPASEILNSTMIVRFDEDSHLKGG